MKKIFIAPVILLMLVGCQSYKASDLKGIGRVAAISVTSNTRFTVLGENNDGNLLAGIAAAGAQEGKGDKTINTFLELTDVSIEHAVKSLEDAFTNAKPFDFVPHQEIAATKTYMQTPDTTNALAILGVTKPKNYKLFLTTKENLENIKAIAAEVNAPVIVDILFSFNKRKQSEILGIGAYKAVASITLNFYKASNPDKTLFANTYAAESSREVGYALGGIYDGEKFQKLMDEAINIAAAKLKTDFTFE